MTRAAASVALLRRGRQLEAATLAWNVIGIAVLGIAALRAHSVALAGFGLDSLIEIGASIVVLWELSGTGQARQRKALRLITGAFLALAAYLTIQGWTLPPLGPNRPSREPRRGPTAPRRRRIRSRSISGVASTTRHRHRSAPASISPTAVHWPRMPRPTPSRRCRSTSWPTASSKTRPSPTMPFSICGPHSTAGEMTTTVAADHWVVFADGCEWLYPMTEDDHRQQCDDGPYAVDWPATLAANPGMRPVDYLDDEELAAWAEADPDSFRTNRVVAEAELITTEAATVPAAVFSNGARPKTQLRKTKRG